MKLSDVKSLLKTMVEKKTAITPMLWGQHGIGKSSVVKQVGDELGYKVLSIILSQKEAVDLAGVLYTFEDKSLGMSVTSSHPPVWFADAVKNGNLILFLDEFNMARKEVLNAAFELVLDRRLNNTKLPDSVFIVCAGNPEDDRYDVTPMSESLRDRFMHIKVTYDLDDWMNWAKGKLNPSIVNFIGAQPGNAYYVDAKNDVFPVEIRHSGRSWERLDMIDKLPLADRIKTECYRGIVGTDVATAYVKYLSSAESAIKFDDIVNDTAKSIKRVKEWSKSNPIRVDLLAATVDNILAVYTTEPAKILQHSDAVCDLAAELPVDLTYKLVSEVYEYEDFGTKMLKHKKLETKLKEVHKYLEEQEKDTAKK